MASNKVGRWRKINKKASKGEGPPEEQAKAPGRALAGKEKLRPGEAGTLKIYTDSSRRERSSARNSGRIPGGAVEPPASRGHHQRKCVQGRVCHTPQAECGKGLELVPGGTSGRAQPGALDGGCCAAFGTQFQWRRPQSPGLRGTAQDPAFPPGQAEARRAQDIEDAPATGHPRAVQISAPCPRSIQASVDRETVVLAARADSMTRELAAAIAVVPPGVTLCLGWSSAAREQGLHRINSSH